MDYFGSFIKIVRSNWLILLTMIFSVAVGWLASSRTLPFANPDEGAHFFRTVEISRGVFINSPGEIGTDISCAEYVIIGHKYAPVAFYQDVSSRDDFNTNKCTVKTVNTAGAYSPVPYIFLAPAEFIGRNLGWSVEKRLVTMRFFNFIGTTLICLAAFFLLSKQRSAFVLVTLSPLVLWLRASVSADGVTISLAILFLALVFSLYKKRYPPSWYDWIWLVFLAILIGSCKPTYALICFFSLLLCFSDWNRNFNRVRLIALTLIPVIVALAASLFWIKAADPALIYLGNNAHPNNQLSFILNNPLYFSSVIYKTIKMFGWDFMYQFWIPYTWVPTVAGSSISTLLSVITLVVIGSTPTSLNKSERFCCIVLFIIISIAICTPLYLTYTPLGFSYILGLQGRYFIPPAFIILFGLMGISRRFLRTTLLFRELTSSILPLLICIWLIEKYLPGKG